MDPEPSVDSVKPGRTCPNCKYELPLFWKRCPSCGFTRNPLADMIWTGLFMFIGIPLGLIATCSIIVAMAMGEAYEAVLIFVASGGLCYFLYYKMKKAKGALASDLPDGEIAP